MFVVPFEEDVGGALLRLGWLGTLERFNENQAIQINLEVDHYNDVNNDYKEYIMYKDIWTASIYFMDYEFPKDKRLEFSHWWYTNS